MMHAYNRMEADQTDSIAVCATKEEWQTLIRIFGQLRVNYDDHQVIEDLTHNLIYAGVYED